MLTMHVFFRNTNDRHPQKDKVCV